jgi:hypothetical protein
MNNRLTPFDQHLTAVCPPCDRRSGRHLRGPAAVRGAGACRAALPRGPAAPGGVRAQLVRAPEGVLRLRPVLPALPVHIAGLWCKPASLTVCACAPTCRVPAQVMAAVPLSKQVDMRVAADSSWAQRFCKVLPQPCVDCATRQPCGHESWPWVTFAISHRARPAQPP